MIFHLRDQEEPILKKKINCAQIKLQTSLYYNEKVIYVSAPT